MGTVAKALSLLAYFSRARPLIGLSDMARLSGMNKATTHRLLSELESAGFVEQVAAGREYRLGAVYLRLAALREHAVPMRDLAAGVLADLSVETCETAHFSILQGDLLVATAHAYSPVHGTRVTMDDAQYLTLHATGSGLAVLAYAGAGMVEAVLSAPLEARTPETITDPVQIRAVLADIRAQGVAESVSGFEQDVHSHAAPIFDAHGAPLGAVAVAAPVARMTPDLRTTIRARVHAAGLRLTRALGGFPPPGYPTPRFTDTSADTPLPQHEETPP